MGDKKQALSKKKNGKQCGLTKPEIRNEVATTCERSQSHLPYAEWYSDATVLPPPAVMLLSITKTENCAFVS